MDLKIVSAVVRVLTVNGSNGFVRVAAGSIFKVGATVNLTSSAPLTNNGLQIQDIKGVVGSTDIALYLIDPVNGQPFDATGYTTAQTATVTQPEQRLWYGVGSDEVPPYSPLTDAQMAAIMLAIMPGGAGAATNVAVTNFPASQPVSITSSPLPTNAATETTLASILAKLNASVAVTGTFWQATQPISAAALPLPAGAATQATLASVLTALVNPLTVTGTVAVTGTFWQATQPISAAALPLPTGAATEVTSAAILAKLLGSVAVTGTFWQATQPISAAALPLPTGASTETTLAAINTKTPALGAALKAASVPVTIATDQGSISTVQNDVVATGNIGALNETVAVVTTGMGVVRFNITGIWTGTLNFEGTVDGVNWVTAGSIPSPIVTPGSSGAVTVFTTTNGYWNARAGGLAQFRIRASTAMTGTATVTLNANQSSTFILAAVIDDGTLDPNNSTTTPLLANITFTGVTTDMLPFTSVTLSSYADVAGTLHVEFSPDGTNWDQNVSYSIAAGQTDQMVFHRRARFFRIVWVNGSVNQTVFRLQTIMQRVGGVLNSVGANEPIDDNASALMTRALLTGRSLDTTGAYTNATVTAQDVSPGPGAVGLVVRNIPGAYGTSAFGEQRVSIPYTLFDMNNKYGRNTRILDTSVAGAGTVTDVLAKSAIQLAVTGANGDQALMRTNQWFQYQAGRGMRAVLTAIHSSTGVGNQTRNWGIFSDSDGLMFRLVGTTLSVVRRTSSGEGGGTLVTPFEVVTAQAAWNQDKMDGTGPSHVTLDITKGNIYEIQYQWLGVGVVQFFVNGTLVHVMSHPNVLAYPYMASGGTLPLSWEVRNTAASTAANMLVICANVTSQSGEDPPEFGFAYERNAGINVPTASGEIPILAMRVSSLYNTLDNRTLIFPVSVSVDSTSSNLVTFRVYVNPATLTGATFAGVVPALCGVEVDIAATAFTGGELLDRRTVTGSAASVALATFNFADIFKKNARILQRLAYAGTSDVLLVTAQAASGATNNVFPGINWKCVP